MMLKAVPHPSGVKVQFDAKWHQYKIGDVALKSVSKILNKYFPFDEKNILRIVAQKTGQTTENVKSGWNRQALLGKNVHAYIESRLLDTPPPAFMLVLQSRNRRLDSRPNDHTGPTASVAPSASQLEEEMLHGEERLYMAAADQAVAAVRQEYDVIGVEQVVASREWGVAGTIDLLARNKRTNKILIGDWKTTSSVTSSFRFGHYETPCTGCLRHLPNSKVYRYAMQILIYGEILKQSRYFEQGFFDRQLRGAIEKSAAAAIASATSCSASLRVADGSATCDIDNTSATTRASSAKKKTRESGKRTTKRQSKTAATASPLLVDSAVTENSCDTHGDRAAANALLELYRKGSRDLFEYGVIQLEKDECGGVVASFRGVQERNVLPPDVPEQDFHGLLLKVIADG